MITLGEYHEYSRGRPVVELQYKINGIVNDLPSVNHYCPCFTHGSPPLR